jgi:hypothetical protein
MMLIYTSTIFRFMRFVAAAVAFLFCFLPAFGQKKVEVSDKIVFVYYEGYPKNSILIPNFGKLHSFKIYRKLKSEAGYQFIIEKEKPGLPLRTNSPGIWSVQWQDPDYHSRDIDYMILAFDKKGVQICEMQVIWEGEK